MLAYVNKVRDVGCDVDNETFTLEQVEANPVRCPDAAAAELMYKGARRAGMKSSDSLGEFS